MTRREKRKYQQLLALFFLFLALFNYPLLSIANKPLLVAGMPLLYLYLFSAWLLMIILLALLVGRGSSQKNQHE